MSSTISFRIGQRIRVADSIHLSSVVPCNLEGGVDPQATERSLHVRAGTYADVIHFDESIQTCDVILYIRDGDVTTAMRADCVTARRFESVRGKPFIPGVDGRRRGGSASAEEPKTTAPSRSAATASEPDVDALLDSLREALTAKGAPTLDHAAVKAVACEAIDALVLPALEHVADRVTALESVTDRVDAAESGMSSIIDDVAELKTTLATVGAALATATPAVRAKVRATLAAKGDPNPIVEALGKFYIPGEEAPANVLLCSPPSLGKSYGVRTFASAYDVYLEHGCSDDMDEIATLLGSPMPDGKGGFITVDGVLTQAVRSAAEGKNVLLLLDEVLRLAPRAQEWLLSFLTGVKRHDGTRCYRLRTRRVDATGALEVIECDAARLHLVGATNLGMLQPVEAFWSRWETVRLDFTPATVQAVASAILSAHGVPDSGDVLAKAWAQIVTESRSAVAEGKLRFPVDMRMLERAAQYATAPTVAEVGKWAAERLADNTAHWNADLGDTDPQSVTVCDGWTHMLRSL
jgi:hypothetical protein